MQITRSQTIIHSWPSKQCFHILATQEENKYIQCCPLQGLNQSDISINILTNDHWRRRKKYKMRYNCWHMNIRASCVSITMSLIRNVLCHQMLTQSNFNFCTLTVLCLKLRAPQFYPLDGAVKSLLRQKGFVVCNSC